MVEAKTRLEVLEHRLDVADYNASTLPDYLRVWWNSRVGRLMRSEKDVIFLGKVVAWFTEKG